MRGGLPAGREEDDFEANEDGRLERDGQPSMSVRS